MAEHPLMSERQTMLGGELYDPFDPDLVAGRERARGPCQALNATRESQHDERRAILRDLFGAGGDSVWMQPPFPGVHIGSRTSSAPGASSRAMFRMESSRRGTRAV